MWLCSSRYLWCATNRLGGSSIYRASVMRSSRFREQIILISRRLNLLGSVLRTIMISWMNARVRDGRHLPSVTTSRNLNLNVRSSFSFSIHDLYVVSSLDNGSYCLIGIVEVLSCLVHHFGAAVMS